MQKVDFIVFSKNRPMQLRSLLESMFHFIGDDIVGSVSVIYTFDPGYEAGYSKIASKFPEVLFVDEINFRDQTISLIEKAKSHVCFLVDDIIFYNKITKEIVPENNEVCFSLRLGKNCSFSHPANSWYNLPQFQEDENYVSWKWLGAEYDFGYPFSLDGHIFRKEDILQICNSVIFRSPNSFENALVYFNPLMEKFKPMEMRSFHHSCLVGIPANRVNNEVQNRFGLEFQVSEEELQTLCNEGKRIAWEEMDFMSIQGPHKEIQFKFNTEK